MLFWLIIVIAVVLAIRNNKYRRDKGYQGQQQPQQMRKQNYQRPVQPVRQQTYQQPTQPRPVQPQAYQRPAGQKANGRYSRMPNPRQNAQPPVQPQPHSDDILSRAAANVRENEEDELLLRTETGKLVTDEPGELIRQVNDLIVMGYQPCLSFERDFVAEGVELLTRYEVSTELREEKI